MGRPTIMDEFTKNATAHVADGHTVNLEKLLNLMQVHSPLDKFYLVGSKFYVEQKTKTNGLSETKPLNRTRSRTVVYEKEVALHPMTKFASKYLFVSFENGHLGSKDDACPAIDYAGTKIWVNDQGEFHRLDAPAVVRAESHWSFVNGRLHSIRDEPAVSDGEWRRWYKYGEPSREGSAPTAISHKGVMEWRNTNGDLHRVGKPAVICQRLLQRWHASSQRN
jgi:hypothetical protein